MRLTLRTVGSVRDPTRRVLCKEGTRTQIQRIKRTFHAKYIQKGLEKMAKYSSERRLWRGKCEGGRNTSNYLKIAQWAHWGPPPTLWSPFNLGIRRIRRPRAKFRRVLRGLAPGFRSFYTLCGFFAVSVPLRLFNSLFLPHLGAICSAFWSD